MGKRARWKWAMGAAIAVSVVAPSVAAQALTAAQESMEPQWLTRTLPELKAETQARTNRNAYPCAGLKPDNVREALSHIHSVSRDEWAAAFMAIGDRYDKRAKTELAKDPAAARDDFHYAWLYYAFGRWPSPNSPLKAESQKRAWAAFLAYGKLANPKIEEIRVPFEGKTIVAYLQKPLNIEKPPVVIDIGGADEWKDSAADEARSFLKYGIADLAVDMPGTGEAPLPGRPGSERMYSALIDYLLTRNDIDGHRIIVRGRSWGSYWSTRVAYAEPKRLTGAIFQAGEVDAYFTRAWQEKALHTKEYLNDFVGSRLYILGQPSVEAMLDYMPSMSLKPLLDKPTPPMLVIEGVHDTQNPFSDTLLLLEHGSPKYAWINPVGGHMGRSKSVPDDEIIERVIIPWMVDRFAEAKADGK